MESHVIYPDFMPEYHCKCGACRRTCCSGDWDIALDKEEYFADTDPGLAPEILAMSSEGMTLNLHRPNEEHYAQMVMDENGRCVFLTEEGLCKWQLKTQSSVGAVCRDFPRMYIRFLQDMYIFPSVSCEAVLELMQKKTEPIQMIQKCEALSCRRYYAQVVQEQIQRRPLLGLYPEFMQYGLDLLQNRKYTLDQRMQLLALAVYTLDQMERAGAVGEILKVLNRLTMDQSAKSYLEMFSAYYGGPQALLLVCGDTFSLFCGKERYKDTVKRILRGLGIGLVCREGKDQTKVYEPRLLDRETYLRKKKLWESHMREIEHFLEHIMAGIFLHNLIPMGEPGPWEGLQYMMACYALLKGGMIGYFDDIPGDEALIDVVVEIMRMCSHNNALYERILDRFKAVKLDNLDAIAALACG